jgi:hypothetical protein
VAGIAGETENDPPSILYSVPKPETGVTAGKANAEEHVLGGDVSVGAGGNTTAFMVVS